MNKNIRDCEALFQSNCWPKTLFCNEFKIELRLGNGHDTTFLSAIVGEKGCVIGLDIQKDALESAKRRILIQNVIFYHQSHEHFPQTAPVKLIVYNLGYLPGGDKSVTTQTATTLTSLQKALKIIEKEGMISITCYPGHEEGAKEQAALIKFFKTLSEQKWDVSWIRWVKRSQTAPSLVLVSPRP